MKILHTSDWHLGHTLYNYDRKEEQQDMLQQIIDITRKEQPDAFLLSGDVYDIPQPSASAQQLFSECMAQLHKAVPGMRIIVTAGNHDSGMRTEAFQSLLSMVDIHTIGTLDKEHSENHIIELPGKGFVIALPYASDRNIPEGFHAMLGDLVAERNTKGLPVVMMAHTTVRSADFRGHDQKFDNIIGGIEGVDISAFGDGYDYLALGHIHRPQTFTIKDCERLARYSGTPIATSFDEDYREPSDSTDSEKRELCHSVSIVEIGQRGELPQVRTIEIKNIHPLVTLPTDGPRPWDDVKTCFDAYPSNLQTYIRLNVAITDSLPSRAYSEAQEIAKDKACKLCQINAIRTEDAHATTHRTMELSEFQQMNPLDILKQFYRDKKGVELPEDLEKMFNEAVQELNEESRES